MTEKRDEKEFNANDHVRLLDSRGPVTRYKKPRKVHGVCLDRYHTVCGLELDDYNRNFFERVELPVTCKRCLNNVQGY